MKAHQIILIAILMLLAGQLIYPVPLYSQQSENEQQKGTSNSGFVFLPVLSYMPETRLTGGLVMNYYFRGPNAEANAKPSNLMPAFIYTQNRQSSIELPVELYWQDELYYASGYIGYAKFPDKFYGIGNDTRKAEEESYTPRIFQIRSNVQRKITVNTYVGIQYNLKYHKMLSTEEDGLLAGNDIIGSGAGTASGVGVSLTRDTRNSVFYPTNGTLIKLLLQQFDGLLGSDYDFVKVSADVRGYFEPFPSHVVAIHGYANFLNGMPPFHLLSLLGQVGERNLMRGYYQGRFRDNNILVLQTEYRMPVWWRFGLAAFGGLGDVSRNMSEFSLNGLKYTYGLGLRFQLIPKENINVRLDFGFGKESSGIYLAFGEAF